MEFFSRDGIHAKHTHGAHYACSYPHAAALRESYAGRDSHDAHWIDHANNGHH